MPGRDPRSDFSLFGGAEVLPPSLRNRSTSLSTSTCSSAATPDSLSEDDGEVETRATTPGEEATEEEKGLKSLPGEQWAPKRVNPPQDGTDFLWMMTEEPHRSRRKAIMKAHPEVSSFFAARFLYSALLALFSSRRCKLIRLVPLQPCRSQNSWVTNL